MQDFSFGWHLVTNCPYGANRDRVNGAISGSFEMTSSAV